MQVPIDTKIRADDIAYVKQRVAAGDSFLALGMPGVGKSVFFRLIKEELEKETDITVIRVDLNEIEIHENHDVYTTLLKKAGADEDQDILEFARGVRDESQTYVFLIDRFEKAVNLVTSDFFDTLRAIVEHSGRHIVFVCSSFKDLIDIRDYNEVDQFYTLVGNFTYFLKPYNEEEASWYINRLADKRGLELTDEQVGTLIKLSGGNSRIINAYVMYLDLHREQDFEQNLAAASDSDPVAFQCQRIIDHLSEQHAKTLTRVANGLPMTPMDEKSRVFLQNMGLVTADGTVFSARVHEYLQDQSKINQPGIHLDEDTGEIFKDGNRIDKELSSGEYALLSYMLENTDRIVQRDEIAEAVWGASTEEGVSDEAIDQLISRIRDKIEEDKGAPKHLITLRGRGFQFKQTA